MTLQPSPFNVNNLIPSVRSMLSGRKKYGVCIYLILSVSESPSGPTFRHLSVSTSGLLPASLDRKSVV